MATTKLNFTSTADLFRPAIVEAKLITEKHACDPVYVATLVEELRNIDKQLHDLEEGLHIDVSFADSCLFQHSTPEVNLNARSIREMSCELDRRLRRVEYQSAKPRNSTAPNVIATVKH